MKKLEEEKSILEVVCTISSEPLLLCPACWLLKQLLSEILLWSVLWKCRFGFWRKVASLFLFFFFLIGEYSHTQPHTLIQAPAIRATAHGLLPICFHGKQLPHQSSYQWIWTHLIYVMNLELAINVHHWTRAVHNMGMEGWGKWFGSHKQYNPSDLQAGGTTCESI